MTDDAESGRSTPGSDESRSSAGSSGAQPAPTSAQPVASAAGDGPAVNDAAVDLTKDDGTSTPAGEAPPAAATAPTPLPAGAGLWQRYRHRRARKKAARAATPHRKAPWWELPALVVLAIGIAILVKSFVIQPFYIPSESMEMTLYGCSGCHGDRILVNKLIYDFRDPHPGDIVVFNAPKGWDSGEPTTTPPSNPVLRVIRGFGQLIGFVPPDGQVLVKRVIAVGGQTVKGDSKGNVYISNTGPQGPYRKLDEPYVYTPGLATQHAFGPVTVPSGRLWVMGDHRNDSADSRFHCIPGGPESPEGDLHCNATSSTVPIGNVIGKAFVIAWPPSRWRTLGTPSTFTSAATSAGPAVTPSAVSLLTVVPIFLIRRRHRRRPLAVRRRPGTTRRSRAVRRVLNRRP